MFINYRSEKLCFMLKIHSLIEQKNIVTITKKSAFKLVTPYFSITNMTYVLFHLTLTLH